MEKLSRLLNETVILDIIKTVVSQEIRNGTVRVYLYVDSQEFIFRTSILQGITKEIIILIIILQLKRSI